jgi:hypothetical protein
MAAGDLRTIRPGMPVITNEGATIGAVKEVRGSYFQVDARLKPDYWLSAELATHEPGDKLHLSVPKDALGEHRLREPGLDPAEDPMAAIAGEPVISDGEMLAQRARMERELAEQSRHLPPHEPSITQVRGTRAWERIPADHAGFGDLAGQYVPNAPVQDQIEYQIEEKFTGPRRGRMLTFAVFAIAASAAVLVFWRRRKAQQPARAKDRIAHVTADVVATTKHRLAMAERRLAQAERKLTPAIKQTLEAARR